MISGSRTNALAPGTRASKPDRGAGRGRPQCGGDGCARPAGPGRRRRPGSGCQPPGVERLAERHRDPVAYQLSSTTVALVPPAGATGQTGRVRARVHHRSQRRPPLPGCGSPPRARRRPAPGRVDVDHWTRAPAARPAPGHARRPCRRRSPRSGRRAGGRRPTARSPRSPPPRRTRLCRRAPHPGRVTAAAGAT